MIYELCKKYCNLSSEDVDKLVEVSKSLSLLSDFYESDVFIDVPSIKDNEAIVVTHVKPLKNKSLYNNLVVGEVALRKNEPGVFNTLETGQEINDIKALTQEYKFVSQKIRPIINNNRVIGAIIVERDISNRIKRDMELENISQNSKIGTLEFLESLKRNKEITNKFEDGIIIFDKKGIVSLLNDKAYEIIDKLNQKKDIEGKSFDELFYNKKKYDEIIEDLGKDKTVREIKIGNYYFKIISIVIGDEEKNLLILIKDITYIKNKEKEIELKTIAVKEANHRIKNNLQTVAAILRKQIREFKGNDKKADLEVCISRILTIAKTHDFLSKSTNDSIVLGGAIRELIENIKISNDIKNIIINLNLDDINIPGEKATALLLVINELIQNCYEHAFNGRDSGVINISSRSDDKYTIIEVNDNGIGYNKDEVIGTSLGLSLVKNYTDKVLNGYIDISSSKDGTLVKIKFLNN